MDILLKKNCGYVRLRKEFCFNGFEAIRLC